VTIGNCVVLRLRPRCTVETGSGHIIRDKARVDKLSAHRCVMHRRPRWPPEHNKLEVSQIAVRDVRSMRGGYHG
jgi:hypothetical protein